MNLTSQTRWINQSLLPDTSRSGMFSGNRTHPPGHYRRTLQVNQALVMVQAVPGIIPPMFERFQPNSSRMHSKPSPQQLALLMANCCLDALTGRQESRHVAHLFDSTVFSTIETWVSRMRRRNLIRHLTQTQVTTVRAQLVSPIAMECTAIVRDNKRAHALALRVERIKGRWRVTDLHLPHIANFR